ALLGVTGEGGAWENSQKGGVWWRDGRRHFPRAVHRKGKKMHLTEIPGQGSRARVAAGRGIRQSFRVFTTWCCVPVTGPLHFCASLSPSTWVVESLDTSGDSNNELAKLGDT